MKSISIDPLLSKTRREKYNCLDFAIEAWSHITGNQDARDKLNALTEGIHAENGRVILSGVRGFKKLDKPESPCFVVMQRKKAQPHIGIYYEGRILDLKESRVEFQPVRISGRFFTDIRFYSYDV